MYQGGSLGVVVYQGSSLGVVIVGGLVVVITCDNDKQIISKQCNTFINVSVITSVLTYNSHCKFYELLNIIIIVISTHRNVVSNVKKGMREV